MREENRGSEGWLDGRMDFAVGLRAVTEWVSPRSVCLTWRLVVWCVSLRSSMWRDAQGNDRANTLIHHTAETREHTVLLAIFIWIKQNICHTNHPRLSAAVQNPHMHTHIHNTHTLTQRCSRSCYLWQGSSVMFRQAVRAVITHSWSFPLNHKKPFEPHHVIFEKNHMPVCCLMHKSYKIKQMWFRRNSLHYDGWTISNLIRIVLDKTQFWSSCV